MRVLKMSFAALLGLSVLTEGASAQSIAGPYLAGRSAAMARDFDAAADYYTRALARDRSNAAMQENTIVALLSRGALDRALPIARLIEEADLKSQVAHMVVTAGLVKDGRYDDLIARDAEDRKIGPLVDGLVQAWA